MMVAETGDSKKPLFRNETVDAIRTHTLNIAAVCSRTHQYNVVDNLRGRTIEEIQEDVNLKGMVTKTLDVIEENVSFVSGYHEQNNDHGSFASISFSTWENTHIPAMRNFLACARMIDIDCNEQMGRISRAINMLENALGADTAVGRG